MLGATSSKLISIEKEPSLLYSHIIILNNVHGLMLSSNLPELQFHISGHALMTLHTPFTPVHHINSFRACRAVCKVAVHSLGCCRCCSANLGPLCLMELKSNVVCQTDHYKSCCSSQHNRVFCFCFAFQKCLLVCGMWS